MFTRSKLILQLSCVDSRSVWFKIYEQTHLGPDFVKLHLPEGCGFVPSSVHGQGVDVIKSAGPGVVYPWYLASRNCPEIRSNSTEGWFFVRGISFEGENRKEISVVSDKADSLFETVRRYNCLTNRNTLQLEDVIRNLKIWKR